MRRIESELQKKSIIEIRSIAGLCTAAVRFVICDLQ